MITKFDYIKNTGVFSNFEWNKSLDDTNHFNKLNIFYGQNYSGKTTLSRILRSFETGSFSKNYVNADFKVKLSDDTEISTNVLKKHNKIIRVFNEDFVNYNLKFIVDSSARILPFAILGEKNNDIEAEIEKYKNELGNKEDKNPTGLYSILALYKKQELFYVDNLNKLQKQLNKKLADKATGKDIGIKYNKKYNQINYDINKLKIDLESIKKSTYLKDSVEEYSKFEDLLNENIKTHIKEIIPPPINFNRIQDKVSSVVTKIVSKSDKISELLQNAILHRWVQEGKDLHVKEETCHFCTGVITNERWAELEKHFDEESKMLEEEIKLLLIDIKEETNNFNNLQYYRKEDFYTQFQKEFLSQIKNIDNDIKKYLLCLEKFKKLAENRLIDILNAKNYVYESDISYNLKNSFNELDDLRIKSNSYSKNLANDQEIAREKLRLKEVEDFARNHNLNELFFNIKSIKQQLLDQEQDIFSVEYQIDILIEKIFENKRLLTDETKGAEKINDYLSNHFGHSQLSLIPVEYDDLFVSKEIYFEIQREGKKAFNLSEGERSLIAFCYFIAKLEDSETKLLKPIIWIDDPISSLDSNHIFFVYSLIKSVIYDNQDFEQLFISTHNLNFLKYLKRLPTTSETMKNKVKYYLIERINNISSITVMPNYLKNHVTEFHHLFKNIYECSKLSTVNDSNYTYFYNFSNNARKFLEIYLFYKYPNLEKEDLKYEKFFDDDEVPKVLINRVINEYSHLCGIIERGETPIDVPEMKKVADLIVRKLEIKDKDQFDALVSSTQIF